MNGWLYIKECDFNYCVGYSFLLPKISHRNSPQLSSPQNIELSCDCIIFVVFDRKIKKRRIFFEKQGNFSNDDVFSGYFIGDFSFEW